MGSIILYWLLFGFIALIIDRYNLYKIEKIIGCNSNFFDYKILKLSLYKIPLGPWYFLSSILYILFNKENIRIANEKRIQIERNSEMIKRFNDVLKDINNINLETSKNMDDVIFKFPRENEENKKIEIYNDKDEDLIKSIDNILDEFDEG